MRDETGTARRQQSSTVVKLDINGWAVGLNATDLHRSVVPEVLFQKRVALGVEKLVWIGIQVLFDEMGIALTLVLASNR